MNLKEAASQMGVHYQTAYKWVRSGDLSAIRVSGRYEVSPAAIARFSARRDAARRDGTPFEEVSKSSEITRDDALEELEAMATDPFVGRRAVATFAARRGAQLLGDLCVVACLDGEGAHDFQVMDHPNPAHAAVLSAAVEALGAPALVAALDFSGLPERRVLRVSHVPQDLLRDRIRPELRQHLSLNPILSLLSASVDHLGRAQGTITFTRDTPGRPYTDADEAFVLEMSSRISVLLSTAEDVTDALASRRRIVLALTQDVAVRPTGPVASPCELQKLLEDASAGTDLEVSVLDANWRVVAVNQNVARRADRPVEAITGMMFKSTTHRDDQPANLASFERLISGELDFLELKVRRVNRHGEERVYVSYRAAVRSADATLRYLVSVARPLRVSKLDHATVSPTVSRYEHGAAIEAVSARP